MKNNFHLDDECFFLYGATLFGCCILRMLTLSKLRLK